SPPSPLTVPPGFPPASLPRLHVASALAPVDSLARSTSHSSLAPLHTPLPLRPVSLPLAPQSFHAHIPCHPPSPPSGSTLPQALASHPRSASQSHRSAGSDPSPSPLSPARSVARNPGCSPLG